jgi:pyruvate dehydrogenase E1 component alpha subunit
MHIADLSKGMLGANAVVGAGAPLAAGAALTAKTLGNGHVAVAFGGDGSLNTGSVFETMNFAVVLKLPLIFAIENNGYGEHTGIKYHLGSKDISSRTAGFGMPVVVIDGTDFFAVHDAMVQALKHVHAGNGPYAIEAIAPRWRGHFEGDPQTYRSPEEIKDVRENQDAVRNFRERVIREQTLDEATLNSIDEEVMALIEDSVTEAKAAEAPRPEDLTTDVYVSY